MDERNRRSHAPQPYGWVREFMEHFRFSIATDHDSRYRAYALRHKVFREELRYNLGDNRDAPFENDAHDQHAILCLLRHVASQVDSGCLRVVVIPPDAQGVESMLPLEEHCGHSLHESEQQPSRFARSTICEVSRLAVHPAFRRHRNNVIDINEDAAGAPAASPGVPADPLVTVSLFLAATAVVGLSGRRHVFAMMEPRFARLLKVSGLNFRQIGKVIDYCGPRAAYYIDQRQAEREMHPHLVPLYQHIRQSLAHQLPRAMPGALDDAAARPG